MSTTAAPRQVETSREPAAGPAYRLFGIVPAGVAPPADDLLLVPYGRVAGLVATAATEEAPAGRRELLTYTALLDRTATMMPVLPVRFGTVLDSWEAVEQRLAAPLHDAYAAALDTLTGRAQFTVRARYLPDAVMAEVLAREPRARQLHRQLRGDPTADHPTRVMLGELVAHALLASRERDAGVLTEALQEQAAQTDVRPPPSLTGFRVADAAFLVDLHRQAEFVNAAEALAGRWRDRARLRLLGPMAAYQFADRLVSAPSEGS